MTKRGVHHWVRTYSLIELNAIPTTTHLNVFRLRSYNILLGMAWLFIHKTKVDCYDNSIDCLYDDKENRILQGKKNPTSVRMVIATQAKHNYLKGCAFFAVHISSDKGNDVEDDEVFKKYIVFQKI